MTTDFIANLLCELTTQLNFIQLETENIIEQSQEAIYIARAALSKLKNYILTHKIKAQQEIHIFKHAMPQILSELIFYSTIQQIDQHIPMGRTEHRKNYINEQLQKIETFHHTYREIITYYRSKDTAYDHIYFLRKAFNKTSCYNPLYFHFDEQFATLHGHTIAHILANQKLQSYLEKILFCIQNPPAPTTNTEHIPTSDMTWTDSKVALMELAVSIYEAKSINHGNVELNAVTDYLQKMFNVQISQPNRTIAEISNRKTDPAKYLNVLTNALINRIDRSL